MSIHVVMTDLQNPLTVAVDSLQTQKSCSPSGLSSYLGKQVPPFCLVLLLFRLTRDRLRGMKACNQGYHHHNNNNNSESSSASMALSDIISASRDTALAMEMGSDDAVMSCAHMHTHTHTKTPAWLCVHAPVE